MCLRFSGIICIHIRKRKPHQQRFQLKNDENRPTLNIYYVCIIINYQFSYFWHIYSMTQFPVWKLRKLSTPFFRISCFNVHIFYHDAIEPNLEIIHFCICCYLILLDYWTNFFYENLFVVWHEFYCNLVYYALAPLNKCTLLYKKNIPLVWSTHTSFIYKYLKKLL